MGKFRNILCRTFEIKSDSVNIAKKEPKMEIVDCDGFLNGEIPCTNAAYPVIVIIIVTSVCSILVLSHTIHELKVN